MSGHTPWRHKPLSTPEEAERREAARKDLDRELAEYQETTQALTSNEAWVLWLAAERGELYFEE